MTVTGPGPQLAEVDLLAELLHKVKWNGGNPRRFKACCPSHDDRTPSLSVKVGDKRPILFWCFAGCTDELILAGVGLTWRTLGEWAATGQRPPAAHQAKPPPAGGRPGGGGHRGVPWKWEAYTYHDAAGVVRFEIVRETWKDGTRSFSARQPGHGGSGAPWIPNVEGVDLLPYRLPELRAAIEAGEPSCYVEGEKDADRLTGEGVAATTSPFGGASWAPEYAEAFAGASLVVVIADNDDTGRKHAAKAAADIARHAVDVRIVEALPGVSPGGDVSDWLDAGGDVNDLWTMGEVVDVAGEPDDRGGDNDDGDDGKPPRKSQATRLVELALDHYRLGVSAEGDPFAMSLDGVGPARLLRGGRVALRSQLAALYRVETGAVPSASGLADALTVLEGEALDHEPEHLYLRVGWDGDAVIIDLADPGDHAVVLEPGGWKLVAKAPVLFRRSALTSPLPVPVGDSSLDELWELVNVAEQSRSPVLAWLVSNLLDCSHPILALLGLHGTGKTTTAKHLAAVFDPSTAAVRSVPRDLDGWGVAASGSYIVPIDNVSSMPAWFSDALCRASTGEGIVRRKLYTDSELSVLSFRRAVALTSIDPGTLRGDLGDRLLPVDIEGITVRRGDEELAAAWGEAHPRILGSMLDVAVSVLAALPDVRLDELPRMADYGRVLAAVDDVLGSSGFAAYRGMRDRVAVDVIESDTFALAIQGLGAFSGTMAELLGKLNAQRPEGERVPKDWPTSPRSARGRLDRLTPALRQLSWRVESAPRSGKANVGVVTLTPPGGDPGSSSTSRLEVKSTAATAATAAKPPKGGHQAAVAAVAGVVSTSNLERTAAEADRAALEAAAAGGDPEAAAELAQLLADEAHDLDAVAAAAAAGDPVAIDSFDRWLEDEQATR